MMGSGERAADGGRGDVIYLDNAATSFPKAPGVGAAIARFVDEAAANPGRAGHRMAVAAEGRIGRVRRLLAELLGVDEPERLIFTLNCTDALNVGIKGVLPAAGETPCHVVTTHLEHNSVSRPLEALHQRGVIRLTRVDSDSRGMVDPEDVAQAMREDTRLVVVSHASNVLGTLQDAAAIGRVVRDHGALFLLDAAQTAGLVDLDVTELRADLVALPGHKGLLGPTGVGALYVGPRCLPVEDVHGADGQWDPTFRAWREGGTGGDSSSPLQPRALPHFLEAGTPNTLGLAGLEAALDYLRSPQGQAAQEREKEVVAQLLGALEELQGVTVLGMKGTEGRVGVVSIQLDGWDPMEAASVLDEGFGIAVRAGLHCSPGAHRQLGTFPQGTLRLSPGPFTRPEEIDAACAALGELMA